METILYLGPPEPGSAREKMFNDYRQQMKDAIQRAITKRHNGEGKESIPFIDGLLQSGAPDEQVSICFGKPIQIAHLVFRELPI